MKPTVTDFLFWQAKQKPPSWAGPFTANRVPDIDGVVNRHADPSGQPHHYRVPPRNEMAAHNLLAILRMRRKRCSALDLISALQEMTMVPGCTQDPEKRAAYAKKWAARLCRPATYTKKRPRKPIKGYVVKVSAAYETTGFSHVVVDHTPPYEGWSEQGPKPVLACGGSSHNMNWTLNRTPPTELCPGCKKEIGT